MTQRKNTALHSIWLVRSTQPSKDNSLARARYQATVDVVTILSSHLTSRAGWLWTRMSSWVSGRRGPSWLVSCL
ncbi:hypothetical protein FJTKL_15441 [Diaporthe vaccinii]|uniref:Uncharacterized protein n=1 Tax=Diaporthe vaccinii TaxID=105482 RepID=A0ABR4E548_9PEZI